MSFAVQTPNGLMAPVLRNIHLKGLEQIATEVKDIAGRARTNKLTMADTQNMNNITTIRVPFLILLLVRKL